MAIFHTDTGSIRNLIVSGNLSVSGAASISGTLNVTNGITGSLLGTASWAENVNWGDITGSITDQADLSSSVLVKIDDIFNVLSSTTNQLIEGTVVWTGDGLNYSASAHTYYIQNQRYTAPAGLITLPAADPSLPRLDIIVADTASNYGFITGSPDSNPVKPVADPETQLELTIVSVGAGATQPGNAELKDVYREGSGSIYSEWSGSVITLPANTTVNFTSSLLPYSGSRNIRVTRTAVGIANTVFQLATSSVDFSGTILTLALSSSTTWANNNSITLGLFNGNTQLGSSFALNNNSLGQLGWTPGPTWGKISIPVTRFGTLQQSTGDRIRFTFSNNTWNPTTIGIDEIQLQKDNLLANTVTLTGDVTGTGPLTGIPTTLANANNTPGTFGSATQIPVITVNAKGLVTVVSTQSNDTSSFVKNSQTSSFVTNSQTSSFVTNSQTSSFVLNSQTSSFVTNSQTGSFATTGSNTFNGSQIISGSLTVTQNLTVLGSASITYISESTLNIGTNLITVNTINPGARFGGLAVIDSGSSPLVSASFLYDSVQDEFVFVHKGDGTNITSSHFLLGPETFNNLGNENYLTENRIPKGTGIEHLNDSNITDTGTIVSINSNTQITGSLNVSNGITGSLFGTASFATSASWAPPSSTPTLQQVTTAGSSSINTIVISGSNKGIDLFDEANLSYVQIRTTDGGIFLKNTSETDEFIRFQSIGANSGITEMRIGGFSYQSSSILTNANLTGNRTHYLPNESGTLVLKVNGVSADTSGSITIPTGSVTVEADPIFTARSASLATTGSNTFIGNQTISGSLDVSGSGRFTDGLTITGSVANRATEITVDSVGFTRLSDGVITSGIWGSGNGQDLTHAARLSHIFTTGAGLKNGTAVFIIHGGTQNVNIGENPNDPNFKLNVSGSGTNGVFNANNVLIVSGSVVSVTGSLDVSGTVRFTNGLTVSGSLFISGTTQSGGNGNVLTYDTSTGQVYYTASNAIGGGGGGPESDPIFTARSASLATTGSNTFRGDQTISGSLNVTSSLNVFGGELVVNSTGVKIGNTIGDIHTLTGSLNVSGSITASLSGTASYANNADLLDGIDSTRFATTGSNTFRGTQTISGSLIVTQSATITGGDFTISTGSGASNTYLRVFPGGNTFIGPSPLDSAFRLEVAGTTRITNTLTVSAGGIDVTGTSRINGATTITGSTNITGSLRVTGSVGITNALTASFGTFSSSFTPSASVLSVYGSGSDFPTFVVRGSQGELFAVTDSLTGSLFSVNNISGLPILEVFSDNTTRIGIWPTQALYTSTRIVANSSSLFTTVYSVQTASFDGLFADYTIRSGSNARAGQIMTIWSGSETRTTDVATTSFGNTNNFEFTSSVVSGELVLQCRTNSNSWTVKTIIRSI